VILKGTSATTRGKEEIIKAKRTEKNETPHIRYGDSEKG
jgi:hypothetical protein